MFFRRKGSKQKEEPQKVVESVVKSVGLDKQKMPIITLDNSWHQLVETIKTPEISALEKKLKELLKEQGKLNTDYIEYSKMKKDMLDKILKLTEEVFKHESEEAKKEIDDQQKMVLKINENLEKTEPRLDVIAEEIQKTNSLLVDESVSLCYSHINKYKKISNKLDEEIQVIRSTLMEKTEEKKEYDKQAKQMYKYLHQLVGPSFIEKLDKVYWDQSE